MICVSIAERQPKDILQLLSGITFGEIRIDRLADRSEQTIRTLFSAHNNLVAAYRPLSPNDETARIDTLCLAIENGAAFTDISIETPSYSRERITATARNHSTAVIISHHDYSGTPTKEELGRIITQARSFGADLVKIACITDTPADAARLLGLLADNHDVIPVGMGKYSMLTRITAPLLGAPFTYASSTGTDETAPGQPYFKTLQRLISAIKKNGAVE